MKQRADVVVCRPPSRSASCSGSTWSRSSRAWPSRCGTSSATSSRRKYTVTVEWPEVKREYSERLRGRHILLTREDGSPRCVACYMCETACPADCIHIEAEEDPTATVECEKRPRVFTIDLLRCVFCGFCVDACPKEAIVMTREHEMAFATREEAIVGLDELRQKGPIESEDLGYRPYY